MRNALLQSVEIMRLQGKRMNYKLFCKTDSSRVKYIVFYEADFQRILHIKSYPFEIAGAYALMNEE